MADVAALKQKRARAQGTISRIKNYTNSIPEDADSRDIETRLNKLRETFREFCGYDDQIAVTPNESSHMESVEDIFFATEASLLRYLTNSSIQQENATPTLSSNLDETLNILASQNRHLLDALHDRTITMPQNDLRMPRLTIPTFDGSYAEWPSFHDLYKTTVHTNTSLSKIQKFQYLKGLLIGEAAWQIRHILVTEENYETAWEKLIDRYDRKKQIVNNYIKTFFEQPHLTQTSATELRRLADTSDEIIRGLETVGSDAKKRDPWLIYILLQKTDAETRQQWASKAADKKFHSFEDFIKFINERCDALEAYSFHSSSTQFSHATQQQVTGRSGTILAAGRCPKCSGNHPLFKCPTFKALSTADRRKLVLRSKLCFNCLHDGHQTTLCSSTFRCHYCNDKHHSSLHQHSTIQNHHISVAVNVKGCSLNSSIKRNSRTQYYTRANNQTKTGSISETVRNDPGKIITNSALSHNTTQAISIIDNNHLHNTHNSPVFQPQIIHHQVSKAKEDNQSSNSNFPFITSKQNVQPSFCSTLLPTAVVYVKDKVGNSRPCRALLDSGSMATFITESCVQGLGLRRINQRSAICGLSAVEVATTKGEVVLQINSEEEEEALQVRALILKIVTSPMPSVEISPNAWPWIQQFKLADPSFYKSQNIDILIGADYFFQVLKEGKIQQAPQDPILQNTMFGWVVAGQHFKAKENQDISHTFQVTVNCNIDKALTKFWELESITTPSCHLSDEEVHCETHFKTHLRTSSDGHFIVRLPFTNSTQKLGNSKRTAISCLLSLERRLAKDPELRHQYNKFMQEYIQLGHMKAVPASQININDNEGFYLPHHAVVKPSSTTTKVRVVFNASRKTSSNVSLNEILGVGPTIQRDLSSILINFRQFQIPISADVAKMYRQIHLDPQDWNYQRIVWRDNPSKRIQDYWLTTVTYGTSSAPFLATRSLFQIANDCELEHPVISQIIKNHFYVDDLLTGADTHEQATTVRLLIEEILASRGFELRKWKSSSKEFMDKIPADKRETECLNFDAEPTKILGLYWNPSNDCFNFHASLQNRGPITKRTILSESAKIFDPLGLLAPATIAIKILFQQLWMEQSNGKKLDWDDVVPEPLAARWRIFREEFKYFGDIKVPRWIYTRHITQCEFHGFCDASESAYSAVIYCRTINKKKISVNIVAAKTRVAPIRQQSLPRLELCGALLLAKLFDSVRKAFDSQELQPMVAWTDSKIVISWLNAHPRRWTTFVANRTATILSLSQANWWRHVTSQDNPADMASRGISPQTLRSSNHWWRGPTWLSQSEDTWPVQQSSTLYQTNNEERKNIIQVFTTSSNPTWDAITSRASSFEKVIRIVAYWKRYISNIQYKVMQPKNHITHKKRPFSVLSTCELQEATLTCLLWAQRTEFAEELKCINSNTTIPSKSKLSALFPYIDGSGLLRVGGRLENSSCSYNAKHPIILPKQHILTSLLISEYHQRYLHPGPTLLLSIMRQKYWIIGGRSTIRQHIHKCLKCFRLKRTTQQQLMGSLPEHRVQPSRPFLHCGVDYAGPIKLRLNRGRSAKTTKGYIALYVCFSTKAIHIEMVSDLTSDAFIASLKRFTARRGTPAAIYSDNATNFVGAKRKLSEVYNLVLSKEYNDDVSNFLAKGETKWHFIPPASPHFGGLWESGIKAVKTHLRRVIGETLLTFEEMATLLTQIEGVLNSRPLTPISDSDVSSLEPLTPGHFLIGTPLTALPEKNLVDINPQRLNRWQQVQRMVQSYWKQWSKDYLHTLNQRPKWRNETSNVAVDDLVLVHEDNLPSTVWILGRIVNIHPGKDGKVRAVTIRTGYGELKRPIVKISKLPIN